MRQHRVMMNSQCKTTQLNYWPIDFILNISQTKIRCLLMNAPKNWQIQVPCFGEQEIHRQTMCPASPFGNEQNKNWWKVQFAGMLWKLLRNLAFELWILQQDIIRNLRRLLQKCCEIELIEVEEKFTLKKLHLWCRTLCMVHFAFIPQVMRISWSWS